MILLIGSTGYIGSEFARQLHKKDGYLAVSYMKVFDPDFEEYLSDVNLIINAAGYTGKPNVDKAEEEKDKCIFGNVVLPTKLVDVCRRRDIVYGHVSSGCIYTGRRSDGKGFTESDEPNFSFKQNNCSFYSGTKALAENIVKEYHKSFIWRLRIPFNNEDSDRNYLSKLMRYHKLINFENSISHKEEFVNACLQTYYKNVSYGIYNVVNNGTVHTSDVTDLISKYIPEYNKFKFFESDEEFYKTAAKTPRSNCVLDNTKLTYSGIKMRNVNEALEDCLKNWKKS
jgi:dTDP-4-dehydrorhamnose reductase